MNEYHILNVDYTKDPRLEQIFKHIASQNTILLLGAGASVGNGTRFLSKDIIDFYEDKKGINWGITDITEFVDTLTTNPNYSREEFDNYVDECLRRYKVTESHKILARLNWREIITTNYDLLIENSFNAIQGTSAENLKLKIIKDKKEIFYQSAKDEVKYIKMNGCISDKKKYKLVFSTEDFENAKSFYRPVLNSIRTLSDNIQILSIGYSYSDALAKKILDRFETYNYREKRTIYSVDPFVNEAMLPWYESKNICIIKCTMEEFFNEYIRWEEKNAEFINKQTRIVFTTNDKLKVYIPAHITKRLNGTIEQLDPDTYRTNSISDKQFYQGEEPNFSIIVRQYDVVKRKILSEILTFINKNQFDDDTRIIPTVFLTGAFGTGKSTFAYRVIQELNQNAETRTLSYEILNPSEIRASDLNELFLHSKAQRIILYFNSIELDSIFKGLLELRHHLSLLQASEYQIIILASIRQNILEKYKINREIKNSVEKLIDEGLNQNEATDLIEKLKKCGIVDYRDINEKNALINKIIKEYGGDSYITMLELVTNNKHINDLIQAYYELSDVCKRAFIYTSLLYQFKILMPAGLLRSLVAKDWQDFRDNVAKVEGKGILIQEEVKSTSSSPDLYFKTKHPLISKHLVKVILKDESKRYEHYEKLIKNCILNTKSSILVIDLLKALRQYKALSDAQINNLFDLAEPNLGEDPRFLLHYAINLQYRKSEESLSKAIEKIIYAESISNDQERNHYLIHRRGVLAFQLAKLIFDSPNRKHELYKVYSLIEESRDLLDIKRRLDPCSSYSYKDAAILELWCLENLENEPSEILKIRIKIEELFDTASRAVYENLGAINSVKIRYIEKYKFQNNNTEYLEYLDNYLESSTSSRPYALILLFNYYFEEKQFGMCEQYVEELQYLTHIREVLRLLFKYYGMRLHIPNSRIKFFNLVKLHPELEEMDELRYNYYRYIAESYNKNFEYAQDIIRSIHDEFNHLNPDFKRDWVNSATEQTEIFTGIIKVNKKGKKNIYINTLGKHFAIINHNADLQINERFTCKLFFYMYGIKAELISKEKEEII